MSRRSSDGGEELGVGPFPPVESPSVTEQTPPCWEMATATCDRLPGVTSMVGYRTLDVPDGTHLGMPSASLTFIVSADEGVEAAADVTQLPLARAQRVILGGLHLRASHVRQRRGQSGIQLAVHPLASRALFGVPAAELSVDDFDGSAVLGAVARQLSDQVAEAASWPAAFDVVAGFVQRSADARNCVRPELRHAWRMLRCSGGRVSVAAVATEVGLTPRHLGTLFRREVGLAPKAVARLMRFETATARIVRSVSASAGVDLADVAATTGFSDQAHLSAEFVAFTGLPPRKWIGAEFRNIQDGGHRMFDPDNHDPVEHDPVEPGRVADPASP